MGKKVGYIVSTVLISVGSAILGGLMTNLPKEDKGILFALGMAILLIVLGAIVSWKISS